MCHSKRPFLPSSLFPKKSVQIPRTGRLHSCTQTHTHYACLPCRSAHQSLPCRQEFTADLKHRMRGVWRDAELVDPNTHNNKLATYHSWFAIPFSRNERLVGLNKVAPCLLCFFPFILTILTTLLRVYQGLSPEPRVCTSHTCCMQMI